MPTRSAVKSGEASRSDASSSDDRALGAIIDDVVGRYRQGEVIDVEQIVADYPGLASELRQVLPTVLALEAPPGAPQPTSGGHASPFGNLLHGRLLGDFRIGRELGRGGMGVVYEAEQTTLERRVALKVLPLAGLLDERQLQRFRNEARAAASLHHPHIVPVHSVGSQRGIHYYAMQYIEGQSLAELVARLRRSQPDTVPAGERFPPSSDSTSSFDEQTARQAQREATPDAAEPAARRAAGDTDKVAAAATEPVYGDAAWFRTVARLGIELAEALEYAHSLGVVHRDIKPANVLLDGQGSTWITDFGLAQLESDAGLTMTGDVLGTLRYMSPEQARAKRAAIDHRTDIYSLGLTLYELLTLRPAFAATDRRELLKQVLEDDPPPPRAVNSSIPYDLETVLLKATRKSAADRYASAQELADDLQRFLELRPVEARRPTLVERAAKWSRRHWAAVTTAVAVLLVAAMAAAGLKLQSDRRTRDVADAVRTSIAVTRTAIEADDLKLAGQKLSEAEGNLRLAAASLPHLAETLGQLRGELERHEQDAERFEQLMELARDAQDKMTHAADRGGEEVAEEALELFVLPGDDWRARLDFAAVDAQQAVALAGVLADDHWLEGGSLTAEQQRQVRETIYETLLCLADFGVRWDERRSEESARASLEYLEVAALFHEPTRGFYWVRAECHAYLGDDEAAEADRERYEQTPARFALDHYLPGHTAGWRGDLDEAIRAYRAALTLQPDNYNAMFFLGMRLESQQRFEKAALAFRACIALRPLESDACWRCADALRQLQRFDEAEQVLVTGLDRARRELGEEHPDTARAMRDLARWHYERGTYAEAEPLLVEALEIHRRVTGEEHRITLASMNNLAELYRAQGRYSEAESLQVQVLETGRRVLGEEDPDTLSSMHNLAEVYRHHGRYSEAESLHEQALESRRRELGDEHPSTLTSMHNLAELYRGQGSYSKAETLHVQALETRQRELGDEHPSTLTSMANLALVYDHQGRYSEAEPLYVQVLEAMQRKLGDAHPNTLASMANLAVVYHQQGRYSEAETLHLQVVEGRRRKLGDEHPSTLTSMNNLAELYRGQGRYDEAEPLYLDTLEIFRRVLGDEHPNTLTSMSNLAVLYSNQGRYSEAEALHVQVLESRRRELGDEHPDTLASMNNLAVVYHQQGRYSEAEPLYVKMLETERRVLGEEHPSTLTSMSNLALLYSYEGRYSEAEALHVQVLESRRRELGDEHPDTLASMNNLAGLYHGQGRYREAKALAVQALEASRRVQGDEHPHTLLFMSTLARLYVVKERYGEAEALFEPLLQDMRRVLGEEHPWTLSAMVRLQGQTYYEQQRYADAEAVLAEALEGRRKALGDEHRHTLRTKDHLARVYLGQQRYADAERLLRERLAVDEESPSDHWQRAHAKALLGKALLGMEQFDEAEARLVSGLQAMETWQDRMPYKARRFIAEAAERLASLRETAKPQPRNRDHD